MTPAELLAADDATLARAPRRRGLRDFKRFLAVQSRVLYHEAGHAVVAFLVGRRLIYMSVLTERDLERGHAGLLVYKPVELSPRSRRETIEKEVMISLAGGIAEKLALPGSPGGDEDDLEDASTFLGYLKAPRHDDVERLRALTEAMLREHWPAVRAVADLAMDSIDGEVNGAEIVRAMRGALA